MTTGNGASGWRLLPFSDLVENVTERVDDPSQAAVKRYVGLEHLDAGSLAIRRWGSPSDVEATKLRFQPDDVIFGRRRAYQRKLAQADFGGICSAHAMQAHFAEVLRSAVSVLDAWRTVAEQLQQVINSSVSEFLDDLPDETFGPLGAALQEVKYGTSAKCGAREPGLVAVLRIPNVVSGRLDLREVKWTSFTEREMENYAVRPGDLLLVRTNGNPDYVGRGTLVQNLPFTALAYASYLLRVRVDPGRLNAVFLSIVLQHPRTRAGLAHLIRSSAGNYNLSASGLESLRFPLPSPHLQDALVDRIRTLQERADAVAEHAAASESMYHALRENWLDGRNLQ